MTDSSNAPLGDTDAAIQAEGRTMKVYVNDQSTVLVTTYPDGSITVATRADSDDLWGPPIKVEQSNG